MSLDSDSDLQAYINELSKKAQDWQYEDEESAPEGKATPSISSSVDIVIDKKVDKQSGPVGQQDAKSNIIRELEVKYLRKDPRSVIQDISFSLSESDLESEKESDSSHKTSINQEQKIETVNADLSSGKRESHVETKQEYNRPPLQHQEQLSVLEDKREFSRTPSREEDGKDRPFFHASSHPTRHQRKLSDSSLLLNKSGIFYSSSISTDRPSNLSYQSGSSDSISEEIPELENDEIPKPKKMEKLSRQESVLYSVKESTEPSQREENEVSAGYGEEDTFESSEVTSSVGNKNVGSDQESVHESSVTSESSEDEKTVKSSKEEITVQSSEKTHVNETSRESNKSVTQMSQESSKSISQRSHDSNKSSTQKSNTSDESVQISPRLSKKKESRRKHTTTESSLSQDKFNSESEKNLERKEKKKYKRKSDTTRKSKSKSSSQRRKKPASTPSISSTDSSSESSSASSSFSIKMKRKKYKEKKRKLKREKEMTELIIKTLVKNLPLILRHTIGLNLEPKTDPKPRYVCRNCGGHPAGWETTNRRIDDALRQTVDLTRQFLDSHRTMLDAENRFSNSEFKYTRLKNYSLG